jgi:hypothetical protein
MFRKVMNFASKNAFNFNDKEVTTLLVISLLGGFILSFRRWGTTHFDFAEGLSNLLLFSMMFFILYFIYLSTQKFTAGLLGLDAKVEVWQYGPPIGVLLTIMSFGLIPFIFFGGVKIREIERLRLGLFRGRVPKIRDLMLIGISGSMMLILLSLLIFFPLYHISGYAPVAEFIRISGLIILISALPFPSLNGISMMLYSRFIWSAYIFYVIILYILLHVLIHVTPSILIYLLALSLSLLVAWLIRHTLSDSKLK